MPNKTFTNNNMKTNNKNKPKRPKRPRRKIPDPVNRPPQVKNTTARNIATTQRSLARGNQTAVALQGMDFISCRLNPFGSMMGTMGIPDNANERRIVVDHRSFCDITFGSAGTVYLRTLPCPAVPLVMKTGGSGNITLNGKAYTMDDPTNLNVGLLPAIINNEWRTWQTTVMTGGPVPTVQDPYQSGCYRIVTQAFKVYYTGAALSASGSITVNVDPISVDGSPRLSGASINYNTYSSAGAATAVAVATGNAFTQKVVTNATMNNILPGSITSRIEQGALILVPSTGNHTFFPTVDSAVLFESATPGAAFLSADIALPWSYAQTMILDTNWQSVSIIISGAPTGQSIRVEAMTCVEYCPNMTSSFARLAKKPESQPSLVAATDAIAAKMPIALPSSGEGIKKYLVAAAKLAKAVAPTVGAMVPALSPIASLIAGLNI